MTTRSVVPTKFETLRTINLDSNPHSLGFLSEDLVASGCGENIEITLVSNGNHLHKFHCSGMVKFATQGGMLHVLCDTENGQNIKTFSSNLQMTMSVPLTRTGQCTMISAAKGYIAVYDMENTVIHILDKYGHHQLGRYNILRSELKQTWCI